MAMLLLGDQTRFRGDQRYHVWRWFTDASWRELYPAEDAEHHGRVSVADLRATAARRHGDADVDGLVRRLLAASPRFAALWGEHEVAVRRSDRKRIVNRQVGVVHVDCETLVTPDLGQKLLVFTPQPGTDAAEKLALLSVVGLQHFST